MPASQLNIHSNTPLGANLAAGGATFRTWEPSAREVYIVLKHQAGTPPALFARDPEHLLTKDASGFWAGFVPGIKDGDLYRFYVIGTGSEGFKRDPYARELEFNGYPDCNCIVRDADAYPWHDAGFRPPAFSDLIIYQFHIGVFYAKDAAGNDIRPHHVCKILDVVDRIEYLADLGVNAVMPLPFQEFQGESSLGYNGTDLFSPEMDYAVPAGERAPYGARGNRTLGGERLRSALRAPTHRADQSAQGVRRPVPSLRHRGDHGCGLQPRRRRFRRPEHQVLRPAALHDGQQQPLLH